MKVGDLVLIARPCECGESCDLGKVFVVSGFEVAAWRARCCNRLETQEFALKSADFGYPKYRLKVIPPLKELEVKEQCTEVN